MSYIKPLTNQV